MQINHLILFSLSFVGIWIGSGLAFKSVEGLSKTLRISSFIVSFIILGLFTSVGELSVGINSIIENDPEIYVGNLIGATIVIFLFLIPLLAIVGNSIRVAPEFQGFNLPASLVVISLPVILAMDGKIDKIDSYISMALYIFLLFSIQTKKGLFEKVKDMNYKTEIRIGKEIIKIFFGVAIIFISSRIVVEQTLYFSDVLKVSPFLISLLVISIGTNIPELSLIIRSIFMRNRQVAFGDYVGSAAFNTFLFGILTLIYNKPVYLSNSYLVSLLFLIFGLLAFYFFARSKHTISRLEGVTLAFIYALFLFTEVFLHKNIIFWK